LDANKDPITLLTAFLEFLKTYPQSTLRILYRNGGLTDRVKQITGKVSSGQISLFENVEHASMREHFAVSTFMISTSHYEGSGTAVCEAMSCGCIPILSNIPSFEMMSDGRRIGLSFTAGDADELLGVLLKTTTMNVAEERKKVLTQYDRSLSAKAIASKSIEVFISLLKSSS
jgi:glycosyltransferase involved in cell wall biosynthesis